MKLALPITAFVYSLIVCVSCDSINTTNMAEQSTPALDISCVSDRQEYGDYNRDMEYTTITEKLASHFFVKISDDFVKIYDINKGRYIAQESVRQYNQKKGVYYFKSGPEAQDDNRVEHDMSTRYIFDAKTSKLCVVSKKSIFEYEATIFHLNCQ